jgi:sugar lactone lactonase YvrE
MLAADDVVGESLLCDDRRRRLAWVDSIGRRNHAFDPATVEHCMWCIGTGPTSLALRADGGALASTERHIYRWNRQGEPEPLVEVEPPGLRTLFVASSRFGMVPEHLATNPQERGLFALAPGVAGLVANRFGALQ